jgi:hypothetical protein
MFSTFLTLLTFWFTTQLQLSNRKCLSMHLLQSNGKSLKWRYNLSCGNRDNKTSFVSEEAFGNNKYAILPSKLLPIRSDQSIIIIPYIHFNTPTTLVDATLIILLFQKCWNFSKNIFSSFKKNCEGKYWIFENILFAKMIFLKNQLIIWQTCAEAAKPKYYIMPPNMVTAKPM